MNLRKLKIYWISRLLFFFLILLLIIHITSNIRINFVNYFFHFFGTYLLSLFLLISTSNRKFYTIVFGIIPIVILSYQFYKTGNAFEYRKNIENSEYDIVVNMNEYRILKKYSFLEKEIAKKESKIFYSPFSKVGITHPFTFDIKVLKDNKKMIILQINTIKNGKTIDSLMKIKTTANNSYN